MHYMSVFSIYSLCRCFCAKMLEYSPVLFLWPIGYGSSYLGKSLFLCSLLPICQYMDLEFLCLAFSLFHECNLHDLIFCSFLWVNRVLHLQSSMHLLQIFYLFVSIIFENRLIFFYVNFTLISKLIIHYALRISPKFMLCSTGNVIAIRFSSDYLDMFCRYAQNMKVFIFSLNFDAILDCISWYQHQQRGNCTWWKWSTCTDWCWGSSFFRESCPGSRSE